MLCKSIGCRHLSGEAISYVSLLLLRCYAMVKNNAYDKDPALAGDVVREILVKGAGNA